ncbi:MULTISPECIES: PP2C family protein-serine/threonine phosphatase [unclassified Paenibacillus]|uniref:PP2C family protein-serine/threonine phosphatase n=1 Tax=unclassified Paenibacillus TaxID=185978 RepID=UPI00362ABD1A
MKTTFAIHWQYGVATHSGWFRMVNEDRSLLRIGSTDKGEPYAVAVIADGMGGSGDGGQASETALETVKEWLDEQLPSLLRSKNIWSALAPSTDRLFHDVNNQLIELGKLFGSRLGTTLTLIFLFSETYFICHIGDCRIYKVSRRNRLSQLTKDQSWTAEQIRKGRLTRQQARKHPKRHVLLQCLGMQKELKLIKRTGFFTKHNTFLLCSDGFYNRVSDMGIERLLREGEQMQPDLQNICDLLIDKALDKRSNDNISLLLLRSVSSTLTPWKRLCYRCKNLNILFPVEWRK